MKKFFFITALMLLVPAFAGLLSAKESNKKLASLRKPETVGERLPEALLPSQQKTNSVIAGETVYSENFDAGAPGWKFQDGWSEAFWHTSTTGAFAGKSYWCGIEELGGYDDNWQQTLTSPPINLAGTTAPLLFFEHHFNIEPEGGGYPAGFDAWDAVTVRISSDGANFKVLSSSTYNANSAYGFNERFGAGVPGWTGNSGGWLTELFDLSSFTGQTVWLQFLLGSDEGLSHKNDSTLFGWRIDDIRIIDGAATIFADDASDTGPAKFIAGGPGGPNPWHFTNTAAASAPNSVGCFEVASGNYLPGMKAGLVSPPIAIDALPPNTQELLADFQLKGRLDPTPYPQLFAGVSIDVLGILARFYREGRWSYWNFLTFTLTLPGSFIGFNEAFPEDRIDVSGLIGIADSVQLQIALLTRPDSAVVAPANLFVDDFSLTAITPTSVKERSGSGIPSEYWLGNNYPNPFNPQTTIAFALPERAKVVLTIHDVLGREIEKLIETEMSSGYHEAIWDAKQRASGVYFYRLTANDFTLMKKMALAR